MGEPDNKVLSSDDEPAIRRYLLGRETEEERRDIEERLLTDRSYSSRIELVETDLADEYVSGLLGQADRECFESRFIASPDRQQKVRIAAALRNHIRTTEAARRPAAAGTTARGPWFQRPVVARWLAAAAIVFAFATAVLLIANDRTQVKLNRYELDLADREQQIRTLSEQIERVEEQRLALESELSAALRAPETAVVLHDSTRTVTLDPDGNLGGFEGLPEPLHRAIRSALTSGRIPRPQQLALLAGTESVLMGSSDGVAFPILNPVGTAVSSQRPTFRWGRLNGATSYVVSIFDEAFQRIARSEPVSGTEWETAQPLARGVTYVWQVTATRDGIEITSPAKPAPEAKFRVLDADSFGEVERLINASSDSHLARAIVYARAGLKREAELELDAVRKQNPGSPVVEALLRSVRSWNRTR